MTRKPVYVEGRKAFKNFENALDAVMNVSHGEIKAALDAEKRDKVARRTKKKASGKP